MKFLIYFVWRASLKTGVQFLYIAIIIGLLLAKLVFELRPFYYFAIFYGFLLLLGFNFAIIKYSHNETLFKVVDVKRTSFFVAKMAYLVMVFAGMFLVMSLIL